MLAGCDLDRGSSRRYLKLATSASHLRQSGLLQGLRAVADFYFVVRILNEHVYFHL